MNNTNNRILIVDDELYVTKICTLALEHYGYKVDASNDPKEALSKYKPRSYDLVILDIKMPEMNGFELFQEIKKKDNNAKICFLTASELYYKEFREKEFRSLDRNLFIRKPVAIKELVAQVNKMINKDTHLEIISLSHR